MVEADIVIEAQRGETGGRELELLMHRIAAHVSRHCGAGRTGPQRVAWIRTRGRGRHPAELNSGDCFAYALARHAGEPLLFKGNDFSSTDVVPVRPPSR